MANAIKGETTFSAGGQDYVLVLDAEALCNLEEATGQPALALLPKLQQGFLSAARDILWAALRTHHPEVSRGAALQLILEAGGVADPAFATAIQAAFERGFPQVKGAAAASDRPRRPAAGTRPAGGTAAGGTGSSSSRSGANSKSGRRASSGGKPRDS